METIVTYNSQDQKMVTPSKKDGDFD